MESGKATGTAASAELLAADINRGKVTLTLLNSIQVSFGLDGETAVVDEGAPLFRKGTTLELNDEAARGQINIIGNTASVAYQTGPVFPNLK